MAGARQRSHGTVSHPPSVTGEPLPLNLVRRVAAEVPSVQEFYLNQVSKVVSFRNTVHNCRINVYYTTGTVGTCLLHPLAGKTQLFRRGVSLPLLKEIFLNPRTHTGTGYFTKDIFHPDSVQDEETALREELLSLEPQVALIKARLAEIEQKKLVEAQKQAQALEDKRKELRKKAAAEAEARAAAEAERVRVERLQEARRLEAVAKSRKINQRGNNYTYNTDYGDLPFSAANVACFALCEGGCVYVTDDGDCVAHGLPDDVHQILVNQKFANIAYIALGECGQYYILKKNGREFYEGGEEFDDVMRSSGIPELVAFGPWGTFFVQFKDGTSSYSEDLYDLLPENVYGDLVSGEYQFNHVALGHEVVGWQGYIPYCLVYGGGYVERDNLDEDAEEWIQDKHPSTKVKQVLIGQDDNYLIRYS